MFGTATAAIGVLDQSRQLINTIREQHRHMRKVPEKCAELGTGLNELDEILHELEEHNPNSMPVMGVKLVQSISKYLESTQKALKRERDKEASLSRARRFLRARRVSEMLDELIGGLKDMELRGLMCGFAAHQAALLRGSPSDAKEDVFAAKYNVHRSQTALY